MARLPFESKRTRPLHFASFPHKVSRGQATEAQKGYPTDCCGIQIGIDLHQFLKPTQG